MGQRPNGRETLAQGAGKMPDGTISLQDRLRVAEDRGERPTGPRARKGRQMMSERVRRYLAQRDEALRKQAEAEQQETHGWQVLAFYERLHAEATR